MEMGSLAPADRMPGTLHRRPGHCLDYRHIDLLDRYESPNCDLRSGNSGLKPPSHRTIGWKFGLRIPLTDGLVISERPSASP